MNRYMKYFSIAVIVSLAAFVMHLLTIEWVMGFVTDQMQDRIIKPSWDVRYVAALTSIEIGFGALLIYGLIHSQLPTNNTLLKGVLLTVLLLMVKGELIRQPLMNWLVGNPLSVVMVQDGMTWCIWLMMGMVIAILHRLFKL